MPRNYVIKKLYLFEKAETPFSLFLPVFQGKCTVENGNYETEIICFNDTYFFIFLLCQDGDWNQAFGSYNRGGQSSRTQITPGNLCL